MSHALTRSRAHRTLLFEYLLGVSLLVTGVVGMTLMQARMLLLQQMSASVSDTLAPWLGSSGYEADDPRSLSPSLRVCGDGLDKPFELPCWKEQLEALLPARPPAAGHWLESYRLVIDGSEREVVVYAGANDTGAGTLVIAEAGSGRPLWRADGSAPPGYFARTRVLGVEGMREPLAARVTVLDADLDGFVDRLYAGDEAGRLWRVDLAGLPSGAAASADNVRHDDPALWSATALFTAGSFATSFATTALQHRHFTDSPDVVQAGDALGRYDAVLIGSSGAGDASGRNWFYMIKDRAVVSGLPPGSLLEHAELRDLSGECSSQQCRDSGSLQHGWRVALQARGEHVSGRPVTAAGNVFFTTRAPAVEDCGGQRALYVLALRDARALHAADSTGGLEPAAQDIIDIVERAAGVTPCRLAQAGG